MEIYNLRWSCGYIFNIVIAAGCLCYKICAVCHDTVAPTVSAGLLNVITAVRICRFPVEVIPFLILYTHRNIEEIVNRQIRISGNVGISMILNRVCPVHALSVPGAIGAFGCGIRSQYH